ncbi:C39 family peptidase [Aquibacillus koreensis]|uniref:C39 family peptidase n=1 Tax=Aquibacillus koreensis TaxID=279446 RepID=A0A9X3WL55_9BACI|nr:C39 family peptidase [Aquibacillus koreensis]MCT2535835.1 C39 family peptidase [Aquibacillus koreensis]MDC3420291.1 C39 family peptidase [Aquibacillus koreensis]
MLQFIVITFSLMMTLILTFLAKKTRRHILKQAFMIYAILFGITSLITSGMILYNHKTGIYNWVKSHTVDEYVSATALPSERIESLLPIVEPIHMREEVHLDVPIIGQHPELPRGCEVTSLAMLLQYHDVDVDKMTLAKQIRKDDTPYKKTKNGVHFGNPHKGFVGSMYSFSKPGYGVYHEPVADLAKQYLGEQVVDFSGGSFEDILNHVNQDRPVWVITNVSYKKLSDKQFETWQTDDGPIQITMKEHSVLVVGYDEEYIYFNEPIKAEKRKVPIQNFKEAWVQMGKQAITVTP